MELESLKPIIDAVMDANKMIKRHAEERIELLAQLFGILDMYLQEEADSDIIDQTLQEIHNMHDIVIKVEKEDLVDETELRKLRIQSVNSILGELDKLTAERDELANILQEKVEGLQGRDELIAILEEYIEIENASNYKMVAEIADLDDLKYQFENSIDLYNVLSKHDPRIELMRIIDRYPQGISKFQLIHMLDCTPYEARKLIHNLLQIGLLKTRERSDILYSPLDKVSMELLTG